MRFALPGMLAIAVVALCAARIATAQDCQDWTAQADALYLTQHKPTNNPLVSDGIGNSLINSSDLHFNSAPGYQLSLTRHHVFDTNLDVEALLMDIGTWNANVGPVGTATGANVNFNPAVNYAGAAGVSAWDQSRLQSGEINGRYQLGEYFSLLAGVRLIEFDDNLGITSYNGRGAELAGDVAGVRNTLIGGQIGLASHVAITERFEVDGFIKAGMFCDHASNSAQEGVVGSGPLSSSASTVNTAFVGQLQISSTYRINDSWSIHSGYQWLWMDGVARAYGQFATSSPASGTATVNTNGTPYFNGAFLGIEFRW